MKRLLLLILILVAAVAIDLAVAADVEYESQWTTRLAHYHLGENTIFYSVVDSITHPDFDATGTIADTSIIMTSIPLHGYRGLSGTIQLLSVIDTAWGLQMITLEFQASQDDIHWYPLKSLMYADTVWDTAYENLAYLPLYNEDDYTFDLPKPNFVRAAAISYDSLNNTDTMQTERNYHIYLNLLK